MYQHEFEVAKSIALQAGEVMRQYFYHGQQRQTKSDGTPLTIADTVVNDLVITELNKAFEEDVVIGEEASTGTYGQGRRWLCDPIDGTKAFTWGVPTAMFSLALVVDGVPVLGVCLEPMVNRLYWAIENQGAYCGSERLLVNSEDLSTGTVAVMSDASAILDSDHIAAIVDQNIKTASFSGAVAKTVRVAEGRFVGYVDARVSPYDMAAVDVIVREAGGKITDFEGRSLDYSRDFKGAVVSNAAVHQQLLTIL